MSAADRRAPNVAVATARRHRRPSRRRAAARSTGDARARGRGLSYAYPDGHQALRGVDLAVGRGERVAVFGPNGAGKTTLVLHLNGINRPDAGEVLVGGVRVEKATLKEVRRRVGIVFQDPDDQLFMPTVREDVAFGPANLGLRGDELDARVAAALAAVGMEAFADRPPHHLSFGQRRRVADGDRAGHGARRPGARRAVLEPRPRRRAASSPTSCGRRASRR